MYAPGDSGKHTYALTGRSPLRFAAMFRLRGTARLSYKMVVLRAYSYVPTIAQYLYLASSKLVTPYVNR